MNSVKKRISSHLASTPKLAMFPPPGSPRIPSGAGDANDLEGVSPELVPIVTLISSQSHRRYHEGIFMLYYDLNGDGKPADREWNEVYGILTGNQLAYWNAANLAQFKEQPDALLQTSAKPNYINFTDAMYNAVKSLPAAKQALDNVIIVSTTLKNRYILQFKTYKDLTVWYSALRLSNFEYSSLQEAYTGALLSARGSRLSDIRTILAEKRFDHEDWVSIRYGSGMAWKRCYAVVEPSLSKKKSFTPGRILLYENEQKKKKQLMAVIINCTAATAIFPQSHLLIDHSTMLKLDGYINFNSPSLSTKVSKSHVGDFKRTSIFLMPEQHSAVPGFDTLIRFIVPLFDSFGLYGRPKRLKANRTDMESLLFGLPTLPRVHYLPLEDIVQLTNSKSFLDWDLGEWSKNIKAVLKSKMDRGYTGCGSRRGTAGALSALNSPLSSPHIMTSPKFTRTSSTSEQHTDSPHSSSSSLSRPPVSAAPREANGGFDKNPKDLRIGIPPVSANAGATPLDVPPLTPPIHDIRLSLDDIYQNYSDINTPDFANIDEGVRDLAVSKNVYPKNDDDLFSDGDDLEDQDDGEEKVDIRRIGTTIDRSPTASPAPVSNTLSGGLKVPQYYDNRSGSYSSVMSPMTQMNELKNEYSKVDRPPYELLSSEEDLNASSPPSSPPPPPAHDPKYLLAMNAQINDVPQGTIQHDKSAHNSIHSESGKVTEVSDSDNSFEKAEVPIPSLPPPKNKPRYISSPNSAQNKRFDGPEPEEQQHARDQHAAVYPTSPLVKPLDDKAELPYPSSELIGRKKSNDSVDSREIATDFYGNSQKQGHSPEQQAARLGSPAKTKQSVGSNFSGNSGYAPPGHGQHGPIHIQYPPNNRQTPPPQQHQQQQQQQRPPPPQMQQQRPPPMQQQHPPHIQQPHQYQQRPPHGQVPPQHQSQRPPQGQPQQQFHGQMPRQARQQQRQPPPGQPRGPPHPGPVHNLMPQAYHNNQVPPLKAQQPPQQQYGRPVPQQYPSQGSGTPRGMIPKSMAQSSVRINPADLRGQGSQQYQYYVQPSEQWPSPPPQQRPRPSNQQLQGLYNQYGQYSEGGRY